MTEEEMYQFGLDYFKAKCEGRSVEIWWWNPSGQEWVKRGEEPEFAYVGLRLCEGHKYRLLIGPPRRAHNFEGDERSMTSPQEVLEDLRYALETTNDTFYQTPTRDQIRAAIALIEQQAAKLEAVETARELLRQALEVATESPWIKCSERLPEERRPILIGGPGHVARATEGSYEDGRFYFAPEGGVAHWATGITHWMPLPELPEARS